MYMTIIYNKPMRKFDLTNCTGFDWDDGNHQKSWLKHQISANECEQVFFNDPLLLFEDEEHSLKVRRYFVLGKTNQEREIFLVFTLRNDLIRVISARDMNKKERTTYETAQKNS